MADDKKTNANTETPPLPEEPLAVPRPERKGAGWVQTTHTNATKSPEDVLGNEGDDGSSK